MAFSPKDFNPFMPHRRYMLRRRWTKGERHQAMGLPVVMERSSGIDWEEARVVDVFVRVQYTADGRVADIPMRLLGEASSKPCTHSEGERWDDELGLVCKECLAPLAACSVWCYVIVERDSLGKRHFVCMAWNPEAQEWMYRSRYRSFAECVRYACMATSPKLACSIYR